MRHHLLGGLSPKSSKTAVWRWFEAWIIVTTKKEKNLRHCTSYILYWPVILMLATVWTNFENDGRAITGNGNAESWKYLWNHNKQAWIWKVTIKRNNNNKKKFKNFIYESWYIIYFIDRWEIAWPNLLDCCGKHDY